MVTISPSPIMILMIWATVMPRAADSSLTVAPEGTSTGPVGWTISFGGDLGRASC